MRNRRRNWLLRRLVLGFAVAAIAAPTAQAVVAKGGTPQFDGGSSAVIQGDDKVFAAPADVYGPLANRHGPAMPYYGGVTSQVRDNEPGRPVGRQVPIAATGTGSDFNWGDGLIGAAAAVGLALLAFGAVRSTRGMSRPATT